jgi:hypothetical protein
MISNPVMFQSRWRLYNRFRQKIAKLGVSMYTAELTYGHRKFVVTQRDNPYHLQFSTLDQLWHKENVLNRIIQHMSRQHPDWRYVLWWDADIEFLREDIIDACLNALQIYHVIQPWENAIDLGPNGETLTTHYSFLSQYIKGKPYCYGKGVRYGYPHWHSGFAWGATREAIESMGGISGPLIDTAILGAGDNHMAHGLIGMLDQTLAPGLHPNYIKHLKTWQDRVERLIRRDVGFVPGTLLHNWHGKKVDRKYHDRWRVLVDNQFNPDTDLERDGQGLYKLADHGDLRSINLRDDIRHYFSARQEDSIDLE